VRITLSARAPRTALAAAFLFALGCSDDATAPAPLPAVPSAALTASPVTVSNVTVASGKTYSVVTGGMIAGAPLYVDRSYTVAGPVSDSLLGATYIRTANDDKAANPGSSTFLSFDVSREAIVYVAMDPALAPPSWLTTAFVKTALVLPSTDNNKRLVVYRRTVSAGRVTLGSNMTTATQGSMYSVIVVPSGAAEPEAPLAVSQVTALSGKVYSVLAGGLTAGARHYVDRTYTVAAPVPAALQGLTLIRTANDDKSASPGSSEFLRFDVNRSAVVYVAMDPALAVPSWLTASFTKTSVVLPTTDLGKKLVVYRRAVPAGRVTLGSNAVAAMTGGSMYVVMVAADTAAQTPTAEPTPTEPTPRQPTSEPPAPAVRAGYYVAPNGTAAGDGSMARPWDLATALAHPSRVQAGDTIWLRGGTYKGRFTSRLAGAAGRPIVVRQYPGERATVDGNIVVEGGNAWLWGFEVMNSDAYVTTEREPVQVLAPGVKVINMTLHNGGKSGIFAGVEAVDAELYGNVIYNNFGHGIYVQNETGRKLISDNVVFNSSAKYYGIHAYGESRGLKNMTFDGNIMFANGESGGGSDFIVGGASPGSGQIVTNNLIYHMPSSGTAMYLGWSASTTGSVATDNYVAGGRPAVRIVNQEGLTFSRNTIVARDEDQGIFEHFGGQSGFIWSGNRYYGNPARLEVFWGGRLYQFSQWRSALGLGSSDTYTTGRPTGVKVVVRANKFESGRGNIAVFNWDRQASVSVDLGNVLRSGDRFEIRHVQRYFGEPIVEGTYSGGSVQLPLPSVQPPTPRRGSCQYRNSQCIEAASSFPTSGPDFNAFVVVRTGN
jgi:hypothetical protein